MRITTLLPTLTGAATGGIMVRPDPAALQLQSSPFENGPWTTWIVRLTLAPPMEQMPAPLRPTILTERAVGPGVG